MIWKLASWIGCAAVLLLGAPVPLDAQLQHPAGGREGERQPAVYLSVRARAAEIPSLARPIAVNLDRSSLGQALGQIAAETGLRLTYSAELLPEGHRVSLRSPRISAAEAVLRVLRGTRLDLLVAASGHAVLVLCAPLTCGGADHVPRPRTAGNGSARPAAGRAFT